MIKPFRFFGWCCCVIILLVLACGTDERDKIREQYGTPEEIQKYDAEDYHTETWWYWCKGISFTFKQEPRGIFCGGGNDWKKESTYQFSPICGTELVIKNQHRLIVEARLPKSERNKNITGY